MCRVGGGEQHAAGPEDWQGRRHEPAVVFVRPEYSRLFRLRERWRVEQDRVVEPLLLRQSAQPIKGVAMNEVVPGWVQLVQREVAFPPIEALDKKRGV